MSFALNDNSLEEDANTSDHATRARRLLQKTAYTMPKLNFCENFHD
jgi:hypothetical protein